MNGGRLCVLAAAAHVLACAAAPVSDFEVPPPPNPPLARYAHEFPAFSIEYPEHWTAAEPQGPGGVFRAEAPSKLPAVQVSVLDRSREISLHQTTTRALAPLLGAQSFVTIILDQEAALRDGKRAREAHLGMALEGVSVDIVALSIYSGSRWVLVTVTGPALGSEAREAMRRIAYTLTVEGS